MNQLKSTFPKLDLRAAEQLGVEVRHDPERRPNSQLCKDGRRRARRHPLDLTQIHEGFWERVLIQDIDKCWLWTKAKCGKKMLYGAVGFNGKKFKSHRLSYILYFGSIDKDLCVCHKCDNPLCVRPDHLFLGTGKDNMQDCVKKGRMYFQIHPRKSVFASPGFQNKFKRLGEKASNSKLAEQQVLEIRKLWKPGMMNSLAKQFNIGCTAILSIVKRKTWKHI